MLIQWMLLVLDIDFHQHWATRDGSVGSAVRDSVQVTEVLTHFPSMLPRAPTLTTYCACQEVMPSEITVQRFPQ